MVVGRVKEHKKKQIINDLFNKISFFEALAKGFNWLFLASLPFLVSANVYGEIIVLSSLVLLISNAGVVGQNKVVLRYVGPESTEYIPYTIIISFIATIFVFFLVILIAEVEGKYHSKLLLVSILFTGYSLQIAFARKVYKSRQYAVVRVGYTFSRLIVGLVLIVYYGDPAYYLVTEIVSLFFVFFIFRPDVLSFFRGVLNLEGRYFFKLFKFGLPLTIHSLALFSLAFSDRLILSIYMPGAEVGKYGAIYTYASSLTFVYVVLAVLWEPRIYQAKSIFNAEKAARVFLRRSLGIGVLLGFVVFFFYWLMFVNSQNDYKETTLSFVLVLLGHLVMPFYFRACYLLIYIEKTHFVTISSVLAGVLNFGLNLYFVPILGIEGAAAVTLVSYVVLFLFASFLYERNKQYFIGRE